MLQAFEIGMFRVLEGVERREWQAMLSILLSITGDTAVEDRYLTLVERLGSAHCPHLELEPASTVDEELNAQEAREIAKRTYAQGVAVTKEVVNSIRMGRTSSVKKVKRAVQMIVDQVLTNETSIIGLTTLRDYDEYTFTHSVNVCIFAVALGRKIGLTKLQLYDLGMTALLHDIGKAKIPIEILNKTSGLAEDEWRVIQAHPWRGGLTLFGLRAYDEIPYKSILVAHEHHMKTDLTGYPRSIRPQKPGHLLPDRGGGRRVRCRHHPARVPDRADRAGSGAAGDVDEPAPRLRPDRREGTDQSDRGVSHRDLRDPRHVRGRGRGAGQSGPRIAQPAAGPRGDRSLRRRSSRHPASPSTWSSGARTGQFLRSIVKVTNPDRYGLMVGDYFL